VVRFLSFFFCFCCSLFELRNVIKHIYLKY
jgi:hypothetical protein